MSAGPEHEMRVFTCLNAEWTWLSAQDRNARQVQSWLLDAGVPYIADAAQSLDTLLNALQRQSLHEGSRFSDLWLGALLRRATGGGEGAQLAARVVLQAMLPAAVQMTQRLVRPGERREEVAQVVLAALWQAVRSYSSARRPERVAGHLRLEMWHHTSRDLKREFTPSPALAKQPQRAPADDGDPAVQAEEAWVKRAAAEAGFGTDLAGARREMVELLVWALAEKVLSPTAAESIADHYREGAPGDRTAAPAAGMHPAAFRQRRNRAVSTLRAAAGQWATAA